MSQLPMLSNAPVSVGSGGGWRPPDELPELGAYDELGIDCETTGLDVHGADAPIGIAICTMPDHQRWYLPFGHRGGGNLDEGLIKRWAKTELRDKHLYNLNIKFESHHLHNWGVDLEAQGCSLHEVQHAAALLDERQYSYSLDVLARKYLGRGKKALVTTADKIVDLHSRLVGEYAEDDALLAVELHEKFKPMIKEERLERVLALEDDLLYCTCEMERNGVSIDVDKLERWISETAQRYEDIIIKEIYNKIGLRVDPDSAASMSHLYNALGLAYGMTEPTSRHPRGQPSFTKDALAVNENPYVQLAFAARQVQDLRTNFLLKYRRALRDGVMYYQLHQLRNDEYGAISGRYAASNVNIQQVYKPDKQPASLLKWIVRELFIPRLGRTWISADASQIEFRLFAHYANSRRLIDAYNNDPKTDFHQLVTDLIRKLIPDYKRVFAKNVSFCKIYGGGRDKVAWMLHKTREEVDPIVDAYDEEFPEARRLSNQASKLAERRGYVTTFLGRRRRFKEGDKFYSALNAVIQGTAADVMKKKLIELYRERKRLGLTMFFPVHDEVNGDLENPERVRDVEDVLNVQSFPFRVPILWDVKTAENWRCGWMPEKN